MKIRLLRLLALSCVVLPSLTMAVPQRALVNLSARAAAGSAGPAALASSFTIEGTASKTMLIRAVGPGLATNGVPTGFIGDPALVVFNGFAQRVAENDNWGSAAVSPAIVSATSSVGAFALADGSKDAAVLVTLPPGTYTARVDGVSGATGTGLIEIYDTDTNPRLAYLTLNSRIATSGALVTAGFVITGSVDQTVLVRALGPALMGAGVTGTLANPALTIKNSSSVVVASNDNWGTATANPTLADAATTAGLRPLADGSNDAALLVTLTPGNYTAEITGTSSTTGNALLELAIIDTDRAATFTPALLGPVLPVSSAQPFGFTLSALAIGRPAPTYQWQKNGTPIAAATNPSFSLGNVTAADAANYSVSISNTAGSVSTSPTAATIWSQVNPTIATGSFYSVAYNGTNLYVSVGESGFVSTSVDGLVWTRASIPSGNNNILRSVTYGGGQFVAVGSNGTIRVSTDGVTWTTPTSGTTNQLNGVLHDGTRYVAVGASSTVLYSLDGTNWTAGSLGTPSITLNAVAFKTAGNYVAVASNGTIYATADVTTGTWTAATSNTVNSLNAVAYVNNSLFIAVGVNGTIRSSSTGLGTWTTVTSPTATAALNAVAFGSSTYVILGGNTLLTSPDATTWTSGTIQSVGSAGSNGLLFANSQFISVGFPGSVLTSATGATNTWTLRSGTPAVSYNDTAYGNGRYVAVGANSSILSSPDGATLTSLAPVNPAYANTTFRRIAYAAGTFVAVGDSGMIFISTDGFAWSNRSYGTTNYTAVAYGAGKFVVAGAGGVYATSPDGNVWTPGTGTVGAANVTGLAYGSATPVFVAVNSTGGIYTSGDAITWTAQTSNTTNALNNVRLAGGQFFALGASSTLLTSPDGLAWTNRGLGATGVNLVDVVHGGGMNIAVHTTSSLNTTLFLSADGVTWVPTSLGTNSGPPFLFFSSAGITYGNGAFWGASNSGIVSRSQPNTALSRILTPPANATIAAGGSTTLTVSTNGIPGATYQWYLGRSGDTTNLITGATSASFTTSTSGRYWVRVSGGGSPAVNSASADVVGPAPVITTQPIATTVTVGQGTALTVAATGSGTLSYQWRKFGSPIAGATSATLTLAATTLPDAGYYNVVVSDGLASVNSQGVRVDITPPVASYPTVLRPRASAPRIEIAGGNLSAIVVDTADNNRTYVAGEFTRVNGEVRLGLARFNSDGSYDSSWVPPLLTGGAAIRALLIESDGIIIAGDFTAVGGVARARIAKLNKATGALDPAFASTGTGPSASVYALARQVMADSSVRYLVGGSFFNFGSTTSVNRLARIDATGALDTTFNPGGAGFGGDVRALAIDGTGTTAKIYAGGLFTSHNGVTANRNRLVRLDANGAYDSTFDVGSGFGGDVRALALQGTGSTIKVYAGGQFTSFNGVTTNRNRLLRLDSVGAYDATFDVGSGFGSNVLALAVDSSANVYVGGDFTSFNGTTSNVNRLIRLTSLGARDATFNNALSGASGTVSALDLRETDGKLYIGGSFTSWNGTARDGFARVATNVSGTLDSAPAAVLRRPGLVLAIEPAPSGKWYVGGFFHFIDDVPRNHFARFNADGTFDSSFNTVGTGFNGTVSAVAVQGDGRIMVGGSFSSYNNTTRQNLARLFADGSFDFSFSPGAGNGFTNGQINALLLQPDGKMVAGGSFTSFNGGTLNRIARLNSDGSSDTAFNTAVGTGFANTVHSLALQSDGGIIVGGTFITLNGASANDIARLAPTGAPDAAFTTAGGTGFNGTVFAVATRLNDKIVAGGSFSTFNSVSRGRVALLGANGALDTGFAPSSGANSQLNAIALQSDDKILLGGFFNSVNGTPRNVFARVNANGSTDTALAVPTAITPVSFVNVVRYMPDGNLIVGATRLDFAEFAGRGALVVLEPAAAPAITTPPSDQVAAAGGSATFTVSGTGENLQYQWLKNGAPISGATAATLSLTNLTVADVASYSVIVSNLYGTQTSAAATLTGSNPPPTITTQPVAATGTVGGSTTLTVAATGTGTLSYQWRKFGVPIPGATSATLNLAALGLDAAGYYDVLVGDGLSVRSSAAVALSVAPSVYPGALRPRATFEPRVERASGLSAFAPLADGRFYAGGSFTTIDGVVLPSIVRFLSDGTVDTSWTPALITGTVSAIAVQADGKIVIGGSFGYVGGRNSFRLGRLNTDGTVDTSFGLGSGMSGGNVNALAIQPADQKILVGGAFTSINSTPANRVVRLNPDGSPDGTFNTGAGFDASVAALLVQSDGNIVVGGSFTSFDGVPANRIARLTPAGAADATFVTGSGFDGTVNALALQAGDNRILVGGAFTTYAGVASARLARLSATGLRDAALPLGTGFAGTVNALTVQPDGRIVVGGQFTGYNGMVANRLARLDGTTGALDAALNTTLGTTGVNGVVRSVALQGTTGQILIGGGFAGVNVATRFGLARFNPDGSLDALTRSLREPGFVFAVQPVAGGKVVIGGSFSHIAGAPASGLARLDASGTVDSTFNSGLGSNLFVRAIVQQGDGKLVIAGSFAPAGGTSASNLARISADGALDTAFANALGTGFNGQINALALLPDGRIAAGGSFSTLNGASANRIARIAPSGAPDIAFSTANGTAFNNSVNALVAHPDGRLAVGGNFTTFNGAPSATVARVLLAGGADPSFIVGTGFAFSSSQVGTLGVNALALQTDDKLVVGGYFGSYNGFPAGSLVRLTSTGGIDHSFAIGIGLSGGAYTLLLQPDGRIVVGGFFNQVSGERRNALARFSATGALDSSFGAPFAFGTGSPINVIAPLSDGSLLLGQTGRQDYQDRITGALTLLENGPAPAILNPPFGGALIAGSTTNVLTVTAAGTGQLTYQWKRNGVALTDTTGDVIGTRTNTLSFSNAQAAHAGDYTVTVTDATGSVTTAPVTITVPASAPVMSGNLFATFGQVIQTGTAAYIAGSATGSAPITATWTKDGVALTGGYYSSGSFYQPLSPAKLSDAGVYQLTLANAHGSTTSAPVRFWVSSESGWTPHNPLPSPQGLAQVVVNNGQFLATGVRGVRFSSTDGIAWNPLPNLGQNNLYGFLEGNGRKLLVGSLGFFALSQDGNTWKTANLPTVEAVQGSAFGAGLFVVTTFHNGSASGRGKIFTSPDGEVWTERYASTSQGLSPIAFGNGAFAVATYDGILRSTDGITWTLRPGTPVTGNDLQFVNGQFVLIGSDSLLYFSSDATVWTSRSYGSTGALFMAYASGQYLLTGANGLLLTSPDAVAWTRRATGTTNNLRSAAYANATWVVLSSTTFPANVLTSTDSGVTWTSRLTAVTYSDLHSLATDGTSSLIAVGDNGTIVRSTDGSAWGPVISGVSDNLEGAAYGAGNYIAVGTNGRIVTSPNGTTWTTAVSGTTVNLYEASFLNNQFVVLSDRGLIARSPDGTSWSLTTLPGNPWINGVTFGAGRYVLVASGGLIFTSPDAATWTSVTSGTTADLEGVAYGNGKFVATGSGIVLSSTDGLAWTSSPGPELPDWDSGTLFIAGQFYAGTGRNSFITSVDGLTWSGHHLGFSYSEINGAAAFQGRLYLVGDAGMIISGGFAPSIVQQPVGQVLAAGSPVRLNVLAAGSPSNVTYQWRKNGTAIAGATGASYTIPSASVTDGGNYDVVVTTATGSVTSATATLEVPSTVALQDQPVSRRITAGGTVQWRVSATTTVTGATLTYQWRKNGVAIAGATASALTLSRVSPADAAGYSVVVGDGTGTATSATAVLTVTTPDPVLWQQFTEFSTEHAPGRAVPDGMGKVYVPWSVYDRNPDMAGGQFVGALARFNEADGTLDPAFRLDARYRRASHVVVQPDGRLLVSVAAGDSSTVIRVTATGAIDTATPFNAPLFARSIRFITRQSDGKVIVVAVDNADANAPASALGAATLGIYRLNADGTLDSGFTPATITELRNVFGPATVDSTGRIYFAGNFSTVNGTSRPGVARLNADGTLDASFPTGIPAGFAYSQVRAVALQSGDRPVFVGDFRYTARGTTADRIMAIRFTAAGAFDTAFAQPLQSQLGIASNSGFRFRHLLIQPDDKIVAVTDRLVRLNADGSPDATFASRTFGKEAFWISEGTSGRLFFADQSGIFGNSILHSTVTNGFAVAAANGTPDFSFQTAGWGRLAVPTDAAVLGDGRFWVAGNFNRFGASSVPGFALFNADGTASATQFSSSRSMVSATIAATTSNRIFAVFGKTSNSTESSSAATFVRVNPDVTVDTTFVPALPANYDFTSAGLTAAPGGKVILAQASIDPQSALNGSSGDALLRLNSDGTRDTTFAPALSAFAIVERAPTTNAVTMIRTGGLSVLQALEDSRVLVVSSSPDSTPVRLLRLSATGAVDAAFNAPSFGATTTSAGFTSTVTDPVTSTTAQFNLTSYLAGDVVRAALQLPDGKVYVGGRFNLSGSPRGLIRLNSDGTLDPTFTGAGIAFSKADAAPYVTELAVDSLGRIYVAGRFDSFNGVARPGIFRLLPNGTVDSGWSAGFVVLDAPGAAVRLVPVGAKLYAFGTVGNAGDTRISQFVMTDIPPPPAIATAPTSTSAATGGTASFSVSASGTGPFTYQWFKNGTAINGATAATLTLNNVSGTDAANYTVAVTGPGGTSVTSPVALTLAIPPSITRQPQTQAVATGTSLTLSVAVAGTPPFTYQWRKDNVAISGATGSSYTIASADSASAGSYTVTVGNSLSTVASAAAVVTVIPAGTGGTHAVVGGGYSAGSPLTITSTITYSGTASALGWQVLLPAGWSFASDTATTAASRPTAGDTELAEWAWTTAPASPVTFTYTLNVPVGQTGDREIVALAIVRQGGDPQQIVAKPDPLVVQQVTTHSSDTDRNFRISLLELTRVIELYNTRNGTTRTGCYKLQDGSEDGFAPEPTRASSTVVTLAKYHAADANRDGKLSLLELTRVIELYNYRSGTTRTGQYHVQAGTEDGYAPGP